MCCRSFLTLSDTYVVMPIVVHEFVKEAVPEEELRKPQQLERRACLFRQRIPPDQLNPQVSPRTQTGKTEQNIALCSPQTSTSGTFVLPCHVRMRDWSCSSGREQETV